MIAVHTVTESEQASQQQRLDLSALLRVNASGASQDDLALAHRVMAAGRNGDEYDRALGRERVDALFARGVLRFERGMKGKGEKQRSAVSSHGTAMCSV